MYLLFLPVVFKFVCNPAIHSTLHSVGLITLLRCFVNTENTKEPPPPAGFIAQCYLLYKRQLLCLKRDHTLLVVRLLCHLLIGVIFGYLYMGSGYRANGVLANYVYLYGSLLLLVYTGKMAVTLACKY